MDFLVEELRDADAREFGGYTYEAPYSVYNGDPKRTSEFLDPAKRYFAVVGPGRSLAGFCCFGLEAQVRGGLYEPGEPQTLDVGVGMSPALVGRGYGLDFSRAVLGFGEARHRPRHFRVTIAGFNDRSLRVWTTLGFAVIHSFVSPSGVAYQELHRQVAASV